MTPLLTLPTSFGTAYVDELFSCTLCANCEETTAARIISDVRIEAELQAPGSEGAIAIQLPVKQAADTAHVNGSSVELAVSKSVQGIVEHTLTRPGLHVLGVNVTYSDSTAGEKTTRSFRKVYQFTAQPGIGVKTKITDAGHEGGKRFILEAKIENLAERTVMIEKTGLQVADGMRTVMPEGEEGMLLAPKDVVQIAFVVAQDGTASSPRTVIGRVEVAWRVDGGHACTHLTDWLMTRR